ncbi:hypothetical protein BDF20DRAFT_835729 [Mycotypha africana]|uniref:uncharacterized protein n=1 Tax=Mycotypha africana TaxID=64632 RepID=UPI00230137A1|nr:uncharacterized protein BDF20DRAFT_835729 [Mycotypha africana]KAI8979759.1 hypothetical protein BDF20DRAFT_835729 [Mycotypha africana]
MPPPQQRGRPRLTEAERKALIPSSTMEFAIQRRWAVTIFVCLQAMKIADVFRRFTAAYPEQYEGLVLKWWMLDALYFIILHIAKIPWLQFTPLKTIFLICVMLVTNFILLAVPYQGAGLQALFTLFFGDSYSRQTAVSKAKPVNVNDIVYNSSHILGRHTVHILPYGTAKLNPHDEVYCLPTLDPTKEEEIYIPIILNNTTPRTVSISHFDFDTKTNTVETYSGRDLIRATEFEQADQGIQYYHLRIKKPGAYKLDKIVAKDNMDVRVYQQQALVFTCPYAQFKPKQHQLNSITDYCTGDTEQLQLEVMGVPPLKVNYKKMTNDGTVNPWYNDKLLQLDRIQPENFDSPLLRTKSPKTQDPSFFSTSAMSKHLGSNHNLEWAAVHKLEINLNMTFDTASTQKYFLTRVIDGVGNEIDLSDVSSQSFQVHPRPAVRFQCSQTDPVSLLIGSKSVSLPLSLNDGTGPFSLEYEHGGEIRHIKLNDQARSIEVHSPGEYTLKSIRDRYCPGDVLFPSICQVTQPPLPTVKVQGTAIPSDCNADSEIGMKFVAEFSGAPPYVLDYTVVKHGGSLSKKKIIEHKRERIDRSRHIFSYFPSSAGDYTYEFNVLDDKHYKKRPTGIQPFKQTVHPQPDAYFTKQHTSVRTCLGEDVTVDVQLRGTGPFKLSWTVDDQLYADVVEKERYTINLPPFDRPGHHVISLVDIRDDNGCVKQLEARDFTVDVRQNRPTAFFYTNQELNETVRTVTITEGSTANLPLRLTGEGPWKVSYRNVEMGDRSIVKERFTDPNAVVNVRHTGHYELLEVEDAICKGDVLPPQYLVQYMDKPTLAIDESDSANKRVSLRLYQRRAVCQGTTDALDILFTGHGPFYCSYKEYNQGSFNFRPIGIEEVHTPNELVQVALRTGEAGDFKYVFSKISDQLYTEPFNLEGGALTVEQTVHAIPTVKFSKSTMKKDRKVCVGDTLSGPDMDSIELEFTGTAPFTVDIGVHLESELTGRVITLENITRKNYRLRLPDEFSTAGTWVINLLKVNDANGCGGSIPVDQSDRQLSFQALDIAAIQPVDTCRDICVGDTVDFSLMGVSPFTVQYKFNDRLEMIKSHGSKLSMIADKPGNITIMSVGDQRNKCRSFPKDLTKQIHEVPSSYISGGREIIESIHEGDMVQAVVDLYGTPPFDFEWRRSRLIWDEKNKKHYKGEVLESHNVYGVQEHRYYINTSVEGIIEIVSIKDRYCQYPF